MLNVRQALGLSDHRVQIADIDIIIQRPSVAFHWLRPFHRCSWDDIRGCLSCTPWSVMEIYDDPDEVWSFFSQIRSYLLFGQICSYHLRKLKVSIPNVLLHG